MHVDPRNPGVGRQALDGFRVHHAGRVHQAADFGQRRARCLHPGFQLRGIANVHSPALGEDAEALVDLPGRGFGPRGVQIP